jgi:diguanylate cyclase (GGDEF)-like protein/PAS domain S-box-containing protein
MAFENTPKTILLIEDNPVDAKRILDVFAGRAGSPCDMKWAMQLTTGLKLLAHGGIDLILADLGLPDSQGIATFEQLYSAAPDTPILILAPHNDQRSAEEAIARGAYDYLSKRYLDEWTLPRVLRSAMERKKLEETIFAERERAQVMLNSIGEAVLCTDLYGNVTYLNQVAESMTGWSRLEATGRPISEVFQVIDGITRETVQNPLELAILQNKAICLESNCILIRRGGLEMAIEDSAAPLHDRNGNVTGGAIAFHDVSTARALTLKMFYLAHHDFLTGLPNRMLLNDRIKQAIAFARRNNEKLALLFLDLDKFKNVNDSLGHAIGDKMLQSVAKRLIACGRQSDTVSRQGGDEFVILLPRIARGEDAALSAQKMLAALAAPHSIGGRDLSITASIGISTYPADGQDPDSLLKSADQAMYHAKKNGRNNFKFFRADMNVMAGEPQSFEEHLRRALDRREFLLHYQPTIDLKTGAIAGLEALIRWRQQDGQLVPPLQFVPLAEASGMIVPIGKWVLREACTQLRAWLDEGLPPVSVAVNLSAVEFRSRDFLDAVQAILHETRLEPRFLELELAESVLSNNVESTVSTLQALKQLGVQFAVDNFGAGNSSLSSMQRFPVNALKIDRSLIHQITSDPNRAAVASAVIHMGKALKHVVIAEGVETREQHDFLLRHGCGQAQGFYFSHPLPAEQCARLLEIGIAPQSSPQTS